MRQKLFKRGNISLFLITFVAIITTALVCNTCGADRATIVTSASIGGILATKSVFGLYEVFDLAAPIVSTPGTLGTIAGVIITLIMF